MSVLPPFDLVRPANLAEALSAVADGATPYAGGTELLLAMRAGLLRPAALVDLKTLPELSGVSLVDDHVRIGATVTHRQARTAPEGAHIPQLSNVLGRVGNPRVRAAGTLVGNLCFAEPKSDVATLLAALDARVELASTSGGRTLRLREFLLGPYTTARSDDELVRAILIPVRSGRLAAYGKFQTMERPTVSVAAVKEADGTTRIAVGAVGPVPQVFEFPPGERPDCDGIACEVEVIPDLTGGDAFKRHITRHIASSTLSDLGTRS